ncbi:MAG: hypothetical protein HKO98_07550, partial [Gemmatimonadetes bacterium]|nr:hypothetical protein [Gemmatimonadota bacterium]
FTVNAGTGEGRLDWDWLRSRPVLHAEGAVHHVRLERPLRALMDGRSRRGLIVES